MVRDTESEVTSDVVTLLYLFSYIPAETAVASKRVFKSMDSSEKNGQHKAKISGFEKSDGSKKSLIFPWIPPSYIYPPCFKLSQALGCSTEGPLHVPYFSWCVLAAFSNKPIEPQNHYLVDCLWLMETAVVPVSVAYESIRLACIKGRATDVYLDLVNVVRTLVQSPQSPEIFLEAHTTLVALLRRVSRVYAYLDAVHLSRSRSKLSVAELFCVCFIGPLGLESFLERFLNSALQNAHDRDAIQLLRILRCMDAVLSIVQSAKKNSSLSLGFAPCSVKFMSHYIFRLQSYIDEQIAIYSLSESHKLFPQAFQSIRDTQRELAAAVFVSPGDLYSHYFRSRGLAALQKSSETTFLASVDRVVCELISPKRPYLVSVLSLLMLSPVENLGSLALLYKVYELYIPDPIPEELPPPEELDKEDSLMTIPEAVQPHHSVLLDIWARWLMSQVDAIKPKKSLVESVLTFRRKALWTVKHAFKGDMLFIKELDKLVSRLVWKHTNDVATESVKYLDSLICDTHEALESAESPALWVNEHKLDLLRSVETLYPLFVTFMRLDIQDNFIKVYKIFLARRLLRLDSLLGKRLHWRVFIEKLVIFLFTKDFRNSQSDLQVWFSEWCGALGEQVPLLKIEDILAPRISSNIEHFLGSDAVVHSNSGEYYYEGFVFESFETGVDDTMFGFLPNTKIDPQEVLDSFGQIKRMLRDIERLRPKLMMNVGTLDFLLVVLCKDAWPNFGGGNFGINAPEMLDYKRVIELANSHYFRNVSVDRYHEVLVWSNQLSYVSMDYTHNNGKVLLETSLLVASVLLQFEDDDELSYQEILRRVQILKDRRSLTKYSYEKTLPKDEFELPVMSDPDKLVLRSLATLETAGLLNRLEGSVFALNKDFKTSEEKITLSLMSIKKLDYDL